MTIIEKIKRSVEAATGLPFLYHAAGEINELIARAENLPVAFAFLLDSGTIDDVNGRYRERVTLAVMFADKSQFDFNALENEEIIDRMKIKAYKWLQSLRLSNDLNIVSINQTQRLYDATTDILTGFSVNVTIEDYAGYGECELPDVVFEIKANGEYDVVGIDKVLVNVLPQLEELTITQNGEYLPSDGVAGFSKVTAEFDTSSLPKVKVSTFKVNDACINDDGIWEGENLIDTSECTSFIGSFENCANLIRFDGSSFDTGEVNNFGNFFLRCTNLKNLIINNFNTSKVTYFENCLNSTSIEYINLDNWDMSAATNLVNFFANCNKLITAKIDTWNLKNLVRLRETFGSCTSLVEIDLSQWEIPNVNETYRAFNKCSKLQTIIGGKSIDEVLVGNLTAMKYLKVSTDFSSTILDRASLRALINGLADLTGQTAQTLTLRATLISKLTEEDIAIATNKNWTIA